MNTVEHKDTKVVKGFSLRPLRLGVLCLAIATTAGAADLARVDALLVQAQALLTSARTELATTTTNPTNGTNPEASSAIRLESFAWASGKKTAEPTGLPTGGKYGEGVENGKRCCQWAYGDFILHAWFPSTAKTITGSAATCRWYHFTTTPEPYPGLARYRWTNTHQTKDSKTGVLWYRWAGAK